MIIKSAVYFAALSSCYSASSALDPSSSGYFENHFYEVVTDKRSYEEAQTIASLTEECDATGFLASVGSKEENDFIQSLLGGRQAFIGFDDRATEGEFLWLSGEPVTFQGWADGEPNDFGVGEDCATMMPNGQWQDVKCTKKYPYVVEYDCQSGRALQTLDDAADVRDDRGHRYYYFSSKQRYSSAKQKAEQLEYCGMNGHLVVINSKEENDVVNELAKKSQPFLGYDDIGHEGTFAWNTKEEFSYTNWAPGEPNDWGRGEDCTQLKKDGKWNDIKCANRATYVVEFDCTTEEPIVEPVVPDAEGDFGGHKYYYFSTQKKYVEATGLARTMSVCGEQGHLVVIDSKEENDFVNELASSSGPFIGYDDIGHEGTFAWKTEGEQSSYSNWNPGEPNDWGTEGEDCTELLRSGRWNDIKCANGKTYVVEFDCPLNPIARAPGLPGTSCPEEKQASFGQRQQGFCVRSNGSDQNSGVIKLEGGDYRDGDNNGLTDEAKVTECLKLCACYSGARVTGCEMIWDQGNSGCYVHTDSISHGNNVGRHSCYLVNGGGTNFEGPPGRICTATAWGDPHIVTWDGLKFDAQPQGEVIFATALDDSGLEIQGRLEKAGANFRGNPSVTTGVAAQAESTGPVIHVAVPTEPGTSATYINVGGNSCPVELVVNGEKKSSLFFDEGGASVTHTGREITITFSSTLNIVMKMSHFGRCFFSIDFQLYDCDSRADSIIGLLGSPNRDSSDDWMTRENVILNQPAGVGQFFFEPAFIYTKQNWIIKDETESLFTYQDEETFTTFSAPEEAYDPGLEDLVNEVTGPIQQICGEDITCIVDGETLGVEAAHENQDNAASRRVAVEEETVPNPEPPPQLPAPTAEGEFNNHMYEYYDSKITYEEAKKLANALKKCGRPGYLVVVNSDEENDFVNSLASKSKPFLGYDDIIKTEKAFAWINDEFNSYEHWGKGEPNNYGSGEDCTELRTDGYWNDIKCSNSASVVIEYDCGLATDPPKFPINLAPPAQPQPVPYHEEYHGNHYYRFYSEKKTFAQAKSFAAGTEFCGQTGYLAVVTSQGENEFLASKIGNDKPFIGFSDESTEDKFQWVNKEEVTYESWYPGEPNDWGTGEDCAVMGWQSPPRWNDVPCSGSYGFIVEYDCGLADNVLRAPRAPLICTGPTARAWGDPHMTTFDDLKYDCQAEGEFVLARSLDSHFEVQARFKQGGGHSLGNSAFPVKVTRAVAFNTGEEGVPTIQVEVPDDDGTCPFRFYVNSEYRDVLLTGTGYPHLVLPSVSNNGKTVTFRYVETGTRIDITVKKSSKNGCVLATQLCLPPDRFANERIVGLLGSPNNVKEDDWMDQTGNILPLSNDRRFAAAYDYCVKNWCLSDAGESLFFYPEEGQGFSYYNKCGNMFDDGGLKTAIAEASKETRAACDGDFGCLLDGVVGGIDDAKAAVEVQDQLEIIRMAPPLNEIGEDPFPVLTPVDAGFWGNHYYQVYHSDMTYDEAIEAASNLMYCDQTGYLAAINQAGENNFITKILHGGTPWIGMKQEGGVEGTGGYKWQNGDSSAFTAWREGEPSALASSDGHCVQMGSFFTGEPTSRWNIAACNEHHGFVVEFDCGDAPEESVAPLVCTGPTGIAWGDPHITTFDGLKYDCQGEGEFVLARSSISGLFIQGRFVDPSRNFVKTSQYSVTVTKAIVFNTGEEGSPKIQVAVPDFPTNGVCDFEFHVNDNERKVLVDGVGFDNHVLASSAGHKKKFGQTIVFYYVQTGTTIHVSVKISKKNGCVMALQVCLPEDRLLGPPKEEIVGLLGSPDDNKSNDWIDPELGLGMQVSTDKRFQEAYDYCVKWCIRDLDESRFKYTGNKNFADYSFCDKMYDSAIEDAMTNVDDSIEAICDSSFECMLDGVVGGQEDAESSLSVLRDFNELKLAPPPGITAQTTKEAAEATPEPTPESTPEPTPGSTPEPVDNSRFSFPTKLVNFGNDVIPAPAPESTNSGTDETPAPTPRLVGNGGFGNGGFSFPTKLNNFLDLEAPAPTPPPTPPKEAYTACNCADLFTSTPAGDWSVGTERVSFNGWELIVHYREIHDSSGIVYKDAMAVEIDGDVYETSGDTFYKNGEVHPLPAMIGGYPFDAQQQDRMMMFTADISPEEKLVIISTFGTKFTHMKLRPVRSFQNLD